MKKENSLALGIAFGVAIGTAIGVATDNLGVVVEFRNSDRCCNWDCTHTKE